MADDRFKPESAPRRSPGHRVAELFREDAPRTTRVNTAKSTNRDLQLDGATVRRQVQQPALIAAVHPPGLPAAIGTYPESGTASGGDHDPIRSYLHAIDQRAGGRQ
jgi:hypothetical protein